MIQESKHAAVQTPGSVRERIGARFRRDPHVRITVQMPHSRLVQEVEVTITGVYPHVFCVEEVVGGSVQRHSFQYTDVLTHRVEILDLE